MTTAGEVSPQGRRQIAQFVKAAIDWAGVSASKISQTGRFSRATVVRVMRGEEVSDTMLRAIGDALKLPRDYLLYVGRTDIDEIVRAAWDRDFLRATLAIIAENEGDLSTKHLSAHSRQVLRELGRVPQDN